MNTQLAAVKAALQNGDWTINGLFNLLLADGVAASEAGISARIRDLRKRQYGGHTIIRVPIEGSRQFKYQLIS